MWSENDDSFISSFPVLNLFYFSCFIAVRPSSKTLNRNRESGYSSHSWSQKESTSFFTSNIMLFFWKIKSKELSFSSLCEFLKIWIYAEFYQTPFLQLLRYRTTLTDFWMLSKSSIPRRNLTCLGCINFFIYCCIWFTLTSLCLRLLCLCSWVRLVWNFPFL